MFSYSSEIVLKNKQTYKQPINPIINVVLFIIYVQFMKWHCLCININGDKTISRGTAKCFRNQM